MFNFTDSLIDFIRGLYQESNAFIPLHEPRFIGNERKYVLDAIDSTFVSSVGEYVDKFEKMMCDITGSKYAVATVNGTNSIHLALLVVGVQPNDEVITQPLTFIATANAISYAQATPHFVDVDKDNMGLCPVILAEHLNAIGIMKDGVCYNKTTGNRISACIPMHTFGIPANIEQIIEVCRPFNIVVIEDAAESLGSYVNKKHTGSFGKIGTFSFNGNKTVTAGGGGALVTDDEVLAKKAKHLSTQAKVPHQWHYEHDKIGYNYRMPNLNAALACAQLEQLDSFVKNKRELNALYAAFFSNFNEVKLIRTPENTESNYWLNAVLFKNKQARDQFLEETNSKGVMTRPIWKLMSKLEMFKNCPKSKLSNAEWLEDRVVNITSSVRINE